MGVGCRALLVAACLCALLSVSFAEAQEAIGEGGRPEEPVAAKTDPAQQPEQARVETPEQPAEPQGATSYETKEPKQAKKGKEFENLLEILGIPFVHWSVGLFGLMWIIASLVNRFWGFLSVFCWTRIVDTYWSMLVKYHSFNQWLSEDDGIHMRSGIGSSIGRSKEESHSTSQNLTPFRDFCGWGRSQPSWMGAGLAGEDDRPDQDGDREVTEALAFERLNLNSIHPFQSEHQRSGLTKRTNSNTRARTPLDLSSASLFGNQGKSLHSPESMSAASAFGDQAQTVTQPPSRAPSLTPSFHSGTFPPPATHSTNPFLKGAMASPSPVQPGFGQFGHEPFTANPPPSAPPLCSVTQLRQEMEAKAPAQYSLFSGPPRSVLARDPTVPVPPRHPFMRSKPQEDGETENWWPRSGPAVAGINQGCGFLARQMEDLSLQEKLDLDLYDPAFDQMDRD